MKSDLIKEFDWDEGNVDKSYKKHGISPKESEEVFLDEGLLVVEDIKHQQVETRSIGIGRTLDGKILFVAFTLRDSKVRIISARKAHPKEKKIYEENLKKNPKV